MDAVYDRTQILPSIDRDDIARLSVSQSQRTDPSAMRSRERTTWECGVTRMKAEEWPQEVPLYSTIRD